MKNKFLLLWTLCLSLALCLGLGISGCSRNAAYAETFEEMSGYATGGNAWATDGNAWTTGGNARATDGNAVGAHPTLTPAAVSVLTTPAPTALPEPVAETTGEAEEEPAGAAPTITPIPTPLPVPAAENDPLMTDAEPNGLTAVLMGVCDHYQLRGENAGAVAVKYAAQLLDWYIDHGRDPALARQGTVAMCQFLGIFDAWEMSQTLHSVRLPEKLAALYAAAVDLHMEENKALLDSTSYVCAHWPYEMEDIDAVFSAVFGALNEEKPQFLRLYDGAEPAGSLSLGEKTLTPENLTEALTAAGLLTDKAAIRSITLVEGCLTLDMNEAFLTQLKGLSAAGEKNLVDTLVNICLENLGGESLLLTVDGKTPETDRRTYDEPLKR